MGASISVLPAADFFAPSLIRGVGRKVQRNVRGLLRGLAVCFLKEIGCNASEKFNKLCLEMDFPRNCASALKSGNLEDSGAHADNR